MVYLSMFYTVIMVLWFIGAGVWVWSATRQDKPAYLLVALVYVLVAVMYGGLAAHVGS